MRCKITFVFSAIFIVFFTWSFSSIDASTRGNHVNSKTNSWFSVEISGTLKSVEGEEETMPLNPRTRNPRQIPQPHKSDRSPPVISPPVMDPEMVITPPKADQEMVITPERHDPNERKDSREEKAQNPPPQKHGSD